jgi:threonine/homoserine/homoserine lactone efflux protein
VGTLTWVLARNGAMRFPQEPGRETPLIPGNEWQNLQDAPMIETTLALLLFLLPLAYSPGPGNMFFAAIGGRFGLRASVPATTGYHLATFVVTAAIGLGFSGLSRLSPILFDLLRYGGAAYVLWLAWGFLRAGATTGTAEAREATALDGAILLLFNPKAYLIVGLMFTQFLPASGVTDPALVVWITAVFTLNNLLAFTVWTLAGDLLMRQFRRASSARPMNIAFGVMLAAVAVWMLLR